MKLLSQNFILNSAGFLVFRIISGSMQGIPRDKVITLIRGNDLIALNDEEKGNCSFDLN